MSNRRYHIQSQGSSESVWNVIDTQTASYAQHGITGPDAKRIAIKRAKELNARHRKQVRNARIEYGVKIASALGLMGLSAAGIVGIQNVTHCGPVWVALTTLGAGCSIGFLLATSLLADNILL